MKYLISLSFVLIFMLVALSKQREIASLSCNGYMRLLKGSLLESNINLGVAYSTFNYGLEQAKNRVKQCRCPSISERNFQRQYIPGVEGFLYNFMNDRPALDDSCPIQSDSSNNWMSSTSTMFDSISSCNLNDVSNGRPCLFSIGIDSIQIQAAFDSCPAESNVNRVGFGITQRLPYMAIHCKGDDCENIGYPCQQDSDCGGSLNCWDFPTNLAKFFNWGYSLFMAGIYNQFETCKTPEQLIDGLIKTMLANHWSKTSTKNYSSIKMCIPKLAPIMSLGSSSISATCTPKTTSLNSHSITTVSNSPTESSTQPSTILTPVKRQIQSDTSESTYYCGGVESNSTNVCNGHGTCNLVVGNIGSCICSSGYAGSLCSIPIMCGAFNSTDPNVCNGRGHCQTVNKNPLGYCNCNYGFTGSECEFPISCSPHCQNGGGCIASYGLVGQCLCTGTLYTGSLCEKLVTCNGIAANSSKVCSGHGSCVFATPNFEDAATISTEGVCTCTTGYTGPECNTSTINQNCIYSITTASSWNGILSDGSSVVDNTKKKASISVPVDPLFYDTNKYTLMLKYDCNGVLQVGPNLMTIHTPHINAVSSTLESVLNSVYSCNSGWTSELRRVLIQPYNVKSWMALLSYNSNSFSAGSWTISPLQRIIELLSLSTLNIQMPSTCTYNNYEANGCGFTYTNLYSLLEGQVKIHFHTSRCVNANSEGLPNFYMFCEGVMCQKLLNLQTCNSDSDCGDNIKCTNPLRDDNIYTNLFDLLFLGKNNTGSCVNNNETTMEFYSQIGDAMDYAMGRAKKSSNDFKVCLPSFSAVGNAAKNWADASYSISGGTISLNGLVNYDGPVPSPVSIYPPTNLKVSDVTAFGASFSWTASTTVSSSLTYSLTILNDDGTKIVSVSSISGTLYILSYGLSPLTSYTAQLTANIPASGTISAQQSIPVSVDVVTSAGSSGGSNRVPGGVGSITIIVKLSNKIPKGGSITLSLPSGYVITIVKRRSIYASTMTVTDVNGSEISISSVKITDNVISGVVASDVAVGKVSISLGQVKNPTTVSTSATFGSVATADAEGNSIEQVSISLPPVSYAAVSGSFMMTYSMVLLLSILATMFLL